MVIKTYYIFCCAKCQRKMLKTPAVGYWKTIKEWTCEECKNKENKNG